MARSESGDTISLEGNESVLSRLLNEAYVVERTRGTIPGDAAYHIAASFLRSWPAAYHEKMWGCWSIGDAQCFPRVDYDGRDFYLTVSERPGTYSWQGSVEAITAGFFNKLVELSEIGT